MSAPEETQAAGASPPQQRVHVRTRNEGWRLYVCADCEDEPAHEEMRYDGKEPAFCDRCGSRFSFIDSGPVIVVHPSALPGADVDLDPPPA
jgi:DNA-directed RNA polymerase subunit RPC12/RpoP